MNARDTRDWIAPMLATLVDAAPLPEGWIYEPKLDGVRAIVSRQSDGIHIQSRNHIRIERNYPEVVKALQRAIPSGAILDGEIVASDPRTGVPSFARLQQRMKRADPSPALQREVPVELWVFDCLRSGRSLLTSRPWAERRAMLERTVKEQRAVRIAPVLDGRFDELYGAACELGMEGLIGKRAEAAYRSGRSRDWVKLKCVSEQEFVIIGWTEPKGSRSGLGALLIGYHEGKQLRYAGKVGTGFSEPVLAGLSAELARLERKTPPVAGLSLPPRDGAHWVEPRLVVQVGFTEWTGDSMLRHPRYLGLRDDRRAADVVRERPAAAPA